MRVGSLKANPKNPRKITDERVQLLKKSMDRYGDISGVVFNRKSGQLVGGHQRNRNFDATSKVVITKTFDKPTRTGTIALGYIQHQGERFSYREVVWNRHQEMAANIAANKQAGEWDHGQLTEWMKELDSFDADMDLDLTMFDKDERQEFLVDTDKKGLTDDDDIPDVAEVRTRMGDLYGLGRHRLLCGDSTDKASVARLMNGEKADMVFTDPPYGISIVSSASTIGGAKAMTGSIGQDGKKRILKPRIYRKVENDESPETAFRAIENFPECDWIIWGGNFFAHRLPQSTHWIVWNKHSVDGAGEGAFFSDAELAWTNSKKTSVVTYRHGWSGLFRNGPRDEELTKRVHPTQKPVGLFSEIIKDYVIGDGIVLDPFLGSGSTLIACEKTNRRCFGMEIDPVYVDVIVERWEKYTGKKSKLISSKQVGSRNEAKTS